jgi:hypothetical protein
LAPGVRLDAGSHEDLSWWGTCLLDMNGRRRIIDTSGWASTSFFTDANEGTGIGVFVDSERHLGLTFAECARRFPQLGPPLAPDASVAIHIKELFAVLVAVTAFPDVVRDALVVVRTDNTVVEAAINSGASRAVDPLMMRFVRELFWASVRLNFRIVASYISTFDNGLADALSRQQWPRFFELRSAWAAQQRGARSAVWRRVPAN